MLTPEPHQERGVPMFHGTVVPSFQLQLEESDHHKVVSWPEQVLWEVAGMATLEMLLGLDLVFHPFVV